MAPRSTNTSVSATSKDHNSHASSGFLETDAKGPSSSTLETPDPLEAKPRSNNIDGNSTPRRVSKPILFRSPFSFSSLPSTNQDQAQADIQQSPPEKNIEDLSSADEAYDTASAQGYLPSRGNCQVLPVQRPSYPRTLIHRNPYSRTSRDLKSV
jgi:hypothetical protein